MECNQFLEEISDICCQGRDKNSLVSSQHHLSWKSHKRFSEHFRTFKGFISLCPRAFTSEHCPIFFFKMEVKHRWLLRTFATNRLLILPISRIQSNYVRMFTLVNIYIKFKDYPPNPISLQKLYWIYQSCLSAFFSFASKSWQPLLKY